MTSNEVLDAAGPEQIRAAFAAALDAAAGHTDDLTGLTRVLDTAADRYETLQMTASTLAHLRNAAIELATAAALARAGQQQLQAAADDFDARDGRVAAAVADTGNLMQAAGYAESFAPGHTGAARSRPPLAQEAPVSREPVTIKDPAKVAAKIVLAEGERFAGSAATKSNDDGHLVLAAAVDTPTGRTVHVGVPIYEEDKQAEQYQAQAHGIAPAGPAGAGTAPVLDAPREAAGHYDGTEQETPMASKPSTSAARLPRPARPALPAATGAGTVIPAAVVVPAAVFAEDSEIDVGPGSMMPRGFDGPSVEWFDGSATRGRVLRFTDVDNDLDARVSLSEQQIRELRDYLGRTLAAGAGGEFDAGTGRVTWSPGTDSRYRVQLAGEDGEQAVLSLTPGQMRAWHDQLGADLAAEDTARSTFPGLTGRLRDRVRGQQFDLDSPLTLDAGGLSGEQLAASTRALRFYRGGSFRAIAAHLRGGADPDETFLVRELPGEPGREERLAEHVEAIDQALAAAPLAEPVIVWRGVRELAEHIGADLDADVVGTTWVERSFPSTSVDPGVASVFGDDVLLRLHVPAGVGAIQLDSRPTSREHTREAEVLLPRGLQMRVTGESEVPIGGGGTTFRDGQLHVAPPTPYRVLEVEVTMPAAPKRRRSSGRPPRQRVAGHTTPNRFEVRQADWETSDAAWLTRAEIADLDRSGQLIEPLTERATDTIMDLIPNRDSDPGEADGEPPARPVGPLPRSSEPIRPPNGGWGIDQGLMHFDGAFGRLWNQLGDDRQLQVDGHALGNLIADLGEGITLHRHDTNQALARLRRLREQLPDDRAGRLVDQAIARLDAPPRPVPPLPEQTPEPLRTLMAELNNINLVRRGGDDGFPMSSDGRHETDILADLAHRWVNKEISRAELERGITGLTRLRHESMEGWTEIRDAVVRALATARKWKRP